MARHNPADLSAGAVVLLVAGAFLVYAMANTGQSFGRGYPLHAEFDSVVGLAPGADVRIAGVKVGTVDTIHLDPKSFEADVRFTVQRDVSLSTDTGATVATEGLLGSKYLSLEPGGAEQVLKPGGEITITQGSLNMEALIGKYIFGGAGGAKGGNGDKSQSGSGGGSLAPLKD